MLKILMLLTTQDVNQYIKSACVLAHVGNNNYGMVRPRFNQFSIRTYC